MRPLFQRLDIQIGWKFVHTSTYRGTSLVRKCLPVWHYNSCNKDPRVAYSKSLTRGPLTRASDVRRDVEIRSGFLKAWKPPLGMNGSSKVPTLSKRNKRGGKSLYSSPRLSSKNKPLDRIIPAFGAVTNFLEL